MDTEMQNFQHPEVLFVNKLKQLTRFAIFRVVVQGQESVMEVVSEGIYSSSPRLGALNNARRTTM